MAGAARGQRGVAARDRGQRSDRVGHRTVRHHGPQRPRRLRVLRPAGRGVAGVASPIEPRREISGLVGRALGTMSQDPGEGESREHAAHDLVAADAAHADVVRARGGPDALPDPRPAGPRLRRPGDPRRDLREARQRPLVAGLVRRPRAADVLRDRAGADGDHRCRHAPAPSPPRSASGRRPPCCSATRPGPRAASVVFAASVLLNLFGGRITFLVGLAAAMLAVLALVRRHPWLAGDRHRGERARQPAGRPVHRHRRRRRAAVRPQPSP